MKIENPSQTPDPVRVLPGWPQIRTASPTLHTNLAVENSSPRYHCGPHRPATVASGQEEEEESGGGEGERWR